MPRNVFLGPVEPAAFNLPVRLAQPGLLTVQGVSAANPRPLRLSLSVLP